MSDIYTHNRLQLNTRHIQNQIYIKNKSMPYIATSLSALNVITDYNTFPYTKWYKGHHLSDNPIVDSREAGFRVLKPSPKPVALESYANTIEPSSTCFENACSTIKPCNNNMCFYFENR